MRTLPPFQRTHVSRLIGLLTENGPMRLVAVTGPRQTGKTTMVLQALEELERRGVPCGYAAVDDPSPEGHRFRVRLAEPGALVPGRSVDARWLVSTWERARMVADNSRTGAVVAFDEIQRITNWSGLVKGLWDGDRRVGRPLRVIILGSAPWTMLTGMYESLVGRFDPFPVTHWSLREMQAAFGLTLEEYVFFGGYPGSAVHINDAARWRSYVREAIISPVINRDVLSLTRVDKPSLMRSLMDMAAAYSGQIMSYRKLQGQLEDAGNTTTLARYLDLLSDAGLVAGLEKHSAKPYLVKRSIPKLLVLNTAIMTVGYHQSFEHARVDPAYWGRLCESAVGAHLKSSIASGSVIHLRYWRDQSREVDFVLSSGPHVVAIEVKTGRRAGKVPGLDAFVARFPGARRLLVGTGGVPLDEFLSEPANYWIREARSAG